MPSAEDRLIEKHAQIKRFFDRENLMACQERSKLEENLRVLRYVVASSEFGLTKDEQKQIILKFKSESQRFSGQVFKVDGLNESQEELLKEIYSAQYAIEGYPRKNSNGQIMFGFEDHNKAKEFVSNISKNGVKSAFVADPGGEVLFADGNGNIKEFNDINEYKQWAQENKEKHDKRAPKM